MKAHIQISNREVKWKGTRFYFSVIALKQYSLCSVIFQCNTTELKQIDETGQRCKFLVISVKAAWGALSDIQS